MIRKGKNPFAQWQADTVKARAAFIDATLKDLKSSQFQTISSLAEYVAGLMTKHERDQYLLAESDLTDPGSIVKSPEDVSKSTLLRNKVYRSLLDAFMSQKIWTLGERSKSACSPELKVSKLQMVIADLKSDKARLEKYIDSIGRAQSFGNGVDDKRLDEKAMEAQANCEHLAYAIIQLYSSKPMQILLGLEEGNIVDYSDGGTILVESKHLKTIRDRLEEIEARKNNKRFR